MKSIRQGLTEASDYHYCNVVLKGKSHGDLNYVETIELMESYKSDTVKELLQNIKRIDLDINDTGQKKFYETVCMVVERYITNI